ncbi:hypothetical protein MNBD_GAMMA26-1073 [hydrothermal vent metagenome]|uniref:DUF488 domain-containing protein n=1 Tax=hydrothermal vent metagenome TaxID=652676 RepID=A0A3B1BBL7_9ZZZZ
MNIFSIGFTQKKASQFFELLRNEEIKSLVDVRLNNVSQLAGFAKRDDLMFFLRELCQIDYIHLPDLAPTKDILNAYKKGNMEWSEYEEKFLNLMVKRNIERIDKSVIEDGCLLCSEHKPHNCHRRLVIDYLNDSWDSSLTVKHLY